MARSLNRVQLIGNLTRDPELRYTPSGTAVCSFGLATNRSWTTDTGEKHEETEFHRIVSWNKLAELCSQFLVKGRKVYVEGRLSTRSWTGQDGQQRSTTEVVIDDMILLDSRGQQQGTQPVAPAVAPRPEEPARTAAHSDTDEEQPESDESQAAAPKIAKKPVKKHEQAEAASEDELVSPDDIPF
jgi:single-strand DNA-binding protein